MGAPDLHRRPDHRRHHLGRPRIRPVRSVHGRHPFSWAEGRQAKVHTALQHGCRLQRVAYPLGLPFVRGAVPDALAGADEILDQILRVHRRRHRFGQCCSHGGKGV